ncbi:uncharacterized protein LOC106143588 [Amyelois transitella]|uniref:uncharacterized protein LOC106143588 n=1 Tax=Amyelois transitella TaxID=680683 RepID=UPI00298F5747|nr:uncharacterized protein LOC106143588 [Amyelois transitella]
MASLIFQAFLGPEPLPIGNCVWIDTFNDDERNSYQHGLLFTGVFSQVLTLWLNLALMLTILWKDENYRNLALFTVTSCLRKVADGIAGLPSFRYLDSLFKSNMLSCVMFGYHDCFFSVLEIEALTHVCVARYVMARYAAYGWPLDPRFPTLYIVSTIMFAIGYTYIPMLGFGGTVDYDFSCTTCTYEMMLPTDHQRYIVLILFFMRSIKPAVLMMGMLARAYYLDKNVCTDKEAGKRLTFTRNIMSITVATLIFWAPLALIRGYVVFGQLFYEKSEIIDSMVGFGTPISLAMWLYWISPAVMVLTLMYVDENVRHNMINLRSSAKTAAELADKEAEKEEKQRMNEIEKERGKKKQ